MFSCFWPRSSPAESDSLATRWQKLPLDIKCVIVSFISIKQCLTEMITVSRAMKELVIRSESHRHSTLKILLSQKPLTHINSLQTIRILYIEYNSDDYQQQYLPQCLDLTVTYIPLLHQLKEIHLNFLYLSKTSTQLVSTAFRSLDQLSHVQLSGHMKMSRLNIICTERAGSIMTLLLLDCSISHKDWSTGTLVQVIQPLSQLRNLHFPLTVLRDRTQNRTLPSEFSNASNTYEMLTTASATYHPHLQFITTSRTFNASDLSVLSRITSLTALDMSLAANLYINGVVHIVYVQRYNCNTYIFLIVISMVLLNKLVHILIQLLVVLYHYVL